ncbi:hypothetical protein CFC21_004094 [Triticum aestivum]|uniref:DUF4220 domain-containing protein n=1 Tax=Triticum aestivum TaxID=4565 RepID=A0A3B5Y645_WHEAT|nr:uncharacterized protein LOC123068272 [Triticum aestivum]KAF6986314.1 hypothetical protein CFC21_004093 [Triticum aestivum]KAF6986315.1 hypothetical protein CFC21_004094 [Triticum aestivum]
MAIAWVEALVTRLNFLVFRIVPLVSLGMYLILAIFSDSRRREDKGWNWKRSWKRVLVWVAYQLTDWGPAYVIGNLYLETEPHDKITVAFWVPFLLMHHARSDNISAYATEDIKLWERLIVIEIPLSLGSCFIVCRYILTECSADWFLRWAAGIMLALGLLKHLEGMLALWRSDLGHIRKSGLSNKQTIKLDDYRDQRKLNLEDEEALLIAHDLFEICKGAFCDYKAKMGDRDDKKMDHDAIRSMFTDRWESMCKVVEMELSLIYDILYTKASVVHTCHGYCIRVASPPLTATALLLFFLHCKKGMEPIDKDVSYILLWTTLFLDLRWLFGALASAWTYSYFKRLPHNWLKHELCCRGGWKKLRYWGVSQFLSRFSLWLWTCACPKDPNKSYRRWAGTFGQRNLLDQCTAGNRHSLYSVSRLEIESEDHSRDSEIPYLVKKLVFKVLCADLFPPPQKPTGTGCKDKEEPEKVPPVGGINRTSPPLLPCPREWICSGMDNVPPAWAHHCPCEEAAMTSSGPYEQQTDDCWRYDQAPPETYEQACLWRNVHVGSIHDQSMLKLNNPNNQAAPPKSTDFPPELQDAVLIWHTATDVFLSSNHTAALQDDGKAIKAISDYMVFLLSKRPSMLPGLKLRSLYENARTTLKEIGKVKEKDNPSSYTTKQEKANELAKWMLKNVHHLKDPTSAIRKELRKDRLEGLDTLLEGTHFARVLLRQIPDWRDTDVEKSMRKLACWIPRLQEL